MRTLFRFALSALAVTCVFGDDYPRQPGIDAQNYAFRITLSDETDEISGETTADLRFVQGGVKQVSFDLVAAKDGKGMTVTSVSSSGAALPFTHTGERLNISLPSAPAAGERRQFQIAYHGVAGNGLHIARNQHGDRTFFSWNWPTLGRNWLPMIDHPYDKATSEFLITAPAKYQVVANGLLVEELDLKDARRLTHWKQSVPIASWLNNIGVAQFSYRQFAVSAGVPLQTWVFPQDRENGIITFENPMRQAIEFFSTFIGTYPYEKLAGVQVNGMGGGMEHASAIFYGEKSVTNRPAFSLVAHEVSHQWWGDSVTENDWDDAWLSEGFATYFAALALEHYEGRDAFVQNLKRSRSQILQMEKRSPVPVIHDNLPEIRDGRAPVGLVYQKGGWTLHMLRNQVGMDRFREGMREYYRRYRDANASTADLQHVMEDISGQHLAWFFDQWLKRAGSPAVEGTWSHDAAGQKLVVELTQKQPGEAYRLPIEIAVTISGGPSKIFPIEQTGKTQRFELPCDQAPALVELDPGTKVLMDAHLTKQP